MLQVAADKSILTRRFSRSMPTYERAAVVQAEMAAQLVGDLRSASGSDCFGNVLELGCGTGLLTRRLLENCRVSRLVLNDLVEDCERTARRARQQGQHMAVEFLKGDIETVDFPAGQDLIISNAVLQWAADLRTLLRRLVGRLQPGGILAIASFGPSNLREISQLTGLALPYWSAEEWRTTLVVDCEVLSATDSLRTLWFPSAREVLQHLKQTGVNAMDSQPWSPSKILHFCRSYEAAFEQQDRVPLSFHPVFIIARKSAHGKSLA